MSAIRLRILLGGPLREAARVVYPNGPDRIRDRYYERSAHGGLVFASPGSPTVELVPTPVHEANFGDGQYLRVRQPWGAPSDWRRV